jgi:hypothetical protein
MIKTVEAVIDERGNVRLLEPVRPGGVRRALGFGGELVVTLGLLLGAVGSNSHWLHPGPRHEWR